MVKTAMDSTAAEKTKADSKPAAEVETTVPVRLRPKKLSLSSERTINSRQQASRPNGSAAALAGLRPHDHAGKGARSPADEHEHGNLMLLMLITKARRPSARAGRSCRRGRDPVRANRPAIDTACTCCVGEVHEGNGRRTPRAPGAGRRQRAGSDLARFKDANGRNSSWDPGNSSERPIRSSLSPRNSKTAIPGAIPDQTGRWQARNSRNSGLRNF